ncbi:MAG: hypothetical protein ACXABY_02305 [Candidatus Thorarchaeota archaeon]|jgi:hypothetical protein
MTWAGIAPSGRVWTLNPNGSLGQVNWKEINGDASGVVDSLLVIGIQGNPLSPAIPSLSDVLTWDGTRWAPASSATGSGLVHDLLSNTHSDTTPASPAVGDIIAGSGAPAAWTRFPVGQDGESLSVNSSGLLEWRNPHFIEPLIVTSGTNINLVDSNLRVIVVKTSGSPTTANLPTNPVLGQSVMIKDGKGDSNVNNITILPSSGNTIDGFSGIILSQQYQSYSLMWNGTEWNII